MISLSKRIEKSDRDYRLNEKKILKKTETALFSECGSKGQFTIKIFGVATSTPYHAQKTPLVRAY